MYTLTEKNTSVSVTLEKLCQSNAFKFINNSNLTDTHLADDVLHLKES